jgi:hypothetical protein
MCTKLKIDRQLIIQMGKLSVDCRWQPETFSSPPLGILCPLTITQSCINADLTPISVLFFRQSSLDRGESLDAACLFLFTRRDHVFSIACGNRETPEEALRDRSPLTGLLTSEIIPPSGRLMNEEIRFSALLSDINQHCSLVPRAYL